MHLGSDAAADHPRMKHDAGTRHRLNADETELPRKDVFLCEGRSSGTETRMRGTWLQGEERAAEESHHVAMYSKIRRAFVRHTTLFNNTDSKPRPISQCACRNRKPS